MTSEDGRDARLVLHMQINATRLSGILLAVAILGLSAWLGVATTRPLTPADQLRTAYYNLEFENAVSAGAVGEGPRRDDAQAQAWLALHEGRAGHPLRGRQRADNIRKLASGAEWADFALAGALIFEPDQSAEAIAASERAYARSPTNLDVVWLRAETLRLREGPESALAFIAAQPEAVRSSMQLLSVKATAHADRFPSGNNQASAMDAVLQEFEAAAAADVAVAMPYQLAAWQLLQIQRPDQARVYLEKAGRRAMSPRVFDLYANAIAESAELDQPSKVRLIRSALRRLLAPGKVDPERLSRAAMAYRDLGKEPEADRLLTRLTSEYPESHAAIRAEVERMLKNGRNPSRSSQWNHEVHQRLQEIADRPDLQETGLPRDSMRISADLLARSPRARPELAKATVERLVDRFPQYPDRYVQGAAVLTAYGEYAAAAAFARYGLEHAEALIDASDAANTSLKASALRLYKSRLSLELGKALLGEGRRKAGSHALLEAFEFDPTSRPVMLELARLSERAGDYDSAAAWYVRCAASPSSAVDDCQRLLWRLQPHLDTEAAPESFRSQMALRVRQHVRSRVASSEVNRALPIVSGRFEGLTGTSVDLSAYRGKTLVLTFWAYWCEVCKLQIPRIDRFATSTSGRSEVAYVTVIDERQTSAAREWLSEHKIGLPVGMGRNYMRRYAIDSVPTTWIIDRNGRVVFEMVGYQMNLEHEFGTRIDYIERKQKESGGPDS